MKNFRLNRRLFLQQTASLLAVATLPRIASANAAEALKTSELVYLSPLRSDSSLSRCRGEVWFVQDGKDVMVVTRSVAWRAKAIQEGLDEAMLWVGEVGVWTRSNGRYKSLPSVKVRGRIESDPDAWESVLKLYKEKYQMSWTFWRRRFENGLADGSRTMLRYQIIET